MPLAGPFQSLSTTELLHDPEQRWAGHISVSPAGERATVSLPPLVVGAQMFATATITGETPPGARWDSEAYTSVRPWLCEFRDVIVLGGAGIILAGDTVVADTLRQTAPERDGYRADGGAITLDLPDELPELAGSWLSMLGGGYDNDYNWLLDGLGRLAGMREVTLAGLPNVLLPATRGDRQDAGLALAGLPGGREVRELGPSEAMRVAHLVVPWTMVGYHMPHPALRPFFAALAEQVAPADMPRRIFIDRRQSERQPGAPRCLVNADEVVSALERDGFTPVRLETLGPAAQIALFAGAECIVAPHDAGLANLVFAGPACRLIELHSDHQVNWAFRHLAAVSGVRYDAVLGRQIAQVPAEPGGTRYWQVSALHVRAAAAAAMA